MKSYKLVGSGPRKVLLFPGLLGTRDAFDDMLHYADTERFQYASVEYRGYGAARNEPGLLTLREIVLDAVRLVEFLGWTEVSLGGHSLGALVAQMVAVAMPRRVKAIVSIAGIGATGGSADSQRQAFMRAAAASAEQRAALVRSGTAARYSAAVERIMVASSFDRIAPAAFASYALDGSRTDISGQVRDIPARVLALVGEHDPNCTEQLARDTTLVLYRDARVQILAGAGHYPQIETPLQTITALEHFVDETVGVDAIAVSP
jgi:pimeloyl-ACP methyl ester carboxylesterase